MASRLHFRPTVEIILTVIKKGIERVKSIRHLNRIDQDRLTHKINSPGAREDHDLLWEHSNAGGNRAIFTKEFHSFWMGTIPH